MRDPLPAHSITAGQEVQLSGFRGTFTAAHVTAVQPQTNHLGGRWALLSVRLPSGEETTADTRVVGVYGPEHIETAWCPDCRRTVEVEDRHDEGLMTRAGEETVTVTDLSCGHNITGEPRITGPAPGAPYAGPQTPVAASTAARDLRQARAADQEA